MKLEIGMYVRINDEFRQICLGIGKIKNIVQDSVYVIMSNKNLPISFELKNIEKASFNLINLIEVGDYVNGNPVCQIKKDEHGRTWIYTDSNYKYGYLEEDIVDVVTKEQFDREKYIVERND